MSRTSFRSTSVIEQRMKALREEYGWSQEKVGVAIGIDEFSSRAPISRYELGVHEPPLPTARLIADALGVPLTYHYCEDDNIAWLLLSRMLTVSCSVGPKAHANRQGSLLTEPNAFCNTLCPTEPMQNLWN